MQARTNSDSSRSVLRGRFCKLHMFTSIMSIGWMCESNSPGSTSRPARRTCRVAGPAHFMASSVVPTKRIRPPCTAIASAIDRRPSAV